MYLIDVQGKRLVEKYLGSQAAFGFEDVPTNVTDLALSRQLNPALQTFAAWLAANKDRIPVEASAAGALS